MQKRAKKSMIIILFVLTLVFLGIFLCARNTKNIKTELAVLDSISDSINVNGIVLRKETEIFNNSAGVLNFLLSDGDKVNKGGLIAEVYNNENDALLNKDIKKLNEEITVLENFENSKNSLSINPNYIEKQSYNLLKDFTNKLKNNEYKEALKNKNVLLNLFNERQALISGSDDISEKLCSLKSQRNQMVSSANNKCFNIIASESGYFVGNVDGFENLIDFKDVLFLKPLDVNTLLNSKSNKSNALAKVVNLSYWYFLCNISKDQALKFNINDYVNLILPFYNTKKISAKVVALNLDGKNADATLVLRCNNIDKDILNLRFENLRIDIKDYSGIKISKSAIHDSVVSKIVNDENGNKNKVEK